MRSLSKLWSSSPIFRRLLSGAGATGLGKIWIMLVQIAQVPILTTYWGADTYGLWLMLSTVPVYIALADFGIGTAAGVEMTKHMARDDREAAAKVFQSAWVLLTSVSAGIGGIALLVICGWYYFDSTQLSVQIAAGCMILASILTLQVFIQRAIFTACHSFAKGQFLNDLAIPVQGAGVAVVAWMGGGIIDAALFTVAIRCLWILLFLQQSNRLAPWCRFGISGAERTVIRVLMRPSFAAFSMTLSNAVGLQGMILAIGWAMGPGAAAVFGTIRMLCRAPLQFSSLLSRATLPELTRSQEAGQHALTRRLTRFNLFSTAAVMVPVSLLLAVFGSNLLEIISHDNLTAPSHWFFLAAMSSLFYSLWSTIAIPLVAMNKQEGFAWTVLWIYVIQTSLPVAFSQWPDVPYYGIFLAELCALFAVIRCSKRMQ